jgi:hypothetical protein
MWARNYREVQERWGTTDGASTFESTLNSDADEFWWPQAAGIKEVLAEVPPRYGVVRGAWRNFVARPEGDMFFAERMTARYCTPSFHPHPLSTHSKSVHRAVSDVRVGRGNHEAFGARLIPLRGWYPIEILHFPVRSREQCRRKYVDQFLALEKNAEKGIPGHLTEAYRAFVAGELDEFYEPLVVSDGALQRGLVDGTLAVDERLRDALRSLGLGHGADVTGGRPKSAGIVFGRPNVTEAAMYAAESSALQESDLALALGARVDDLDARIATLERSALARLRGAVRRGA